MSAEKKAPAKRRAIGKKARFEVFKRDSFTCQYCGDSAPQVVLNVDHIKPVAKGGTNRITNLVTSCFACNSGKGDRELSDQTVVVKQKAQLDSLQERRAQLEMMMKWHEGVDDIKKDETKMCVDYFNNQISELAVGRLANGGEKFIASVVKKYPFDDVLKAISIGVEQYIQPASTDDYEDAISNCLKKLNGICRNLHQDEYEKRKHYVKAIINNRHYCMHHTTTEWFFKEFEAAKAAGVPLVDIENRAKNSTGIQDAIEGIAALAVTGE